MDTIDKFIAIAPTIVPSMEGTMSLSAISYPLYDSAVSATDLKYQLFGPKFDERLESLESLLGFFAGPEAVQSYHEANDAIGGFEGIPVKLFLHLGQIIITERFQEYSDCFSTFRCHTTDLYKIDEIQDVPITMILGADDIIAGFDTQKELFKQIQKAPLTVQILDNYEHESFYGQEKDD